MKIGVARTRVIRTTEIEEKFPINYDVIQELVENVDKLLDCLFESKWDYYTVEEQKYVDGVVLQEVLYKFLISFVRDLINVGMIKALKAQFLAYRLLFNLISDKGAKIHIGVLDRCKNPWKAWELFNRVEYLINNFETEILLPDTGDTEDV